MKICKPSDILSVISVTETQVIINRGEVKILREVDMKKVLLSLIAALFVCSIAASAFAAEMRAQGMLKSVNAAKGTVVFCPKNTNKNMTLKATAALMKGFKPGDHVILTYENGTVKMVRRMITKVPVGC